MNQTTEPTHKPIFKLAPVEDDLTMTILRTRRDVIREAELSLGARLLFVEILDLSLNRNLNKGPGIVVISDTKLAEHLGVSDRVIRKWKSELRVRRVIWTQEFYLPNMWPMTTYNVTAISPLDTEAEKTSPEGLWGNGYRRAGLRGTGVPRSISGGEKSQVLDITAPSGTDVPPSAARAFRGERNGRSAGSGTGVPLAAAQAFRGERHGRSAGSGTGVPLAAAQAFRHIEDSGKRIEPLKGGEEAPPREKAVGDGNKDSDAFAKWEVRLDDMKNGHLRQLEAKIKTKLQITRSEAARSGLKRQLKAVQDRLLPPMLEEGTATPAKATAPALPKAKAIPFEERKKRWEEAKAKNFPSRPECVGSETGSSVKQTTGAGGKGK